LSDALPTTVRFIMVTDMTKPWIKAAVSAVALGFLLTCVADAAPVRKRQQSARATAITVTPAYRGAHLFPAGPVMYGNEYLGDDPDPFIRQQILRDLGAHFGGNF
jgi:hypothetical protein